ncbi:MAG: hypothetical protein EBS16_09985 [Betaproteobacteria bacterium]|nr:hypothetical protein [Betaproteobacteria bacterium]
MKSLFAAAILGLAMTTSALAQGLVVDPKAISCSYTYTSQKTSLENCTSMATDNNVAAPVQGTWIAQCVPLIDQLKDCERNSQNAMEKSMCSMKINVRSQICGLKRN